MFALRLRRKDNSGASQRRNVAVADSCTREPNEIGIDVELMLYTERSDDSASNAGPPTAFAHDELVLDVVQTSLDIVGIFDPTPISDARQR